MKPIEGIKNRSMEIKPQFRRLSTSRVISWITQTMYSLILKLSALTITRLYSVSFNIGRLVCSRSLLWIVVHHHLLVPRCEDYLKRLKNFKEYDDL